MAKDLRQSHAVEAPSGSEQSFHSQVEDCNPMSSTNAPAERDVSDKTPDGGKPFSGPGLRRDLSSAASHVGSSGEMRVDCRYCSRKFSSKQGLRIHQGKLHAKEREQAQSAEIQARRAAVNQNTPTSLQCCPIQEVQEVQLPSDYFLSHQQGEQQQSQGPFAADDSSLDLELRLGPPGSVPPLRSKSSQPSGKPRVPPVETRSDYFSSHQQGEQQQSQGPFAADNSSLDLELRLGPPGSVPPLHSQRSGKPDDSSLDLELRLGPPGSVPPLHSQRSGKPSGEARVSRVETPPDCVSSSREQGKQQAQSQRP